TKMASGLVIVSVVGGEERLYSQKMSCPDCGESVPELEPRSFSFNSPYGACEACNGLGSAWAFDRQKVIVDETRPLFDGGLGPGGSSALMRQAVTAAARRARIDISKPFDELSAKRQSFLLDGQGDFPGILKLLDRAFSENPTEGYRDYLMQYMAPSECAVCRGRRLRPSSLAVRMQGLSIADFTAQPIARALLWAGAWSLSEREQQVAAR